MPAATLNGSRLTVGIVSFLFTFLIVLSQTLITSPKIYYIEHFFATDPFKDKQLIFGGDFNVELQPNIHVFTGAQARGQTRTPQQAFRCDFFYGLMRLIRLAAANTVSDRLGAVAHIYMVWLG